MSEEQNDSPSEIYDDRSHIKKLCQRLFYCQVCILTPDRQPRCHVIMAVLTDRSRYGAVDVRTIHRRFICNCHAVVSTRFSYVVYDRCLPTVVFIDWDVMPAEWNPRSLTACARCRSVTCKHGGRCWTSFALNILRNLTSTRHLYTNYADDIRCDGNCAPYRPYDTPYELFAAHCFR